MNEEQEIKKHSLYRRDKMSVLNVRIKHNIATYDLQLPAEATIGQLSDRVADLTGVPVSGQKLIFCGKQLSRDLSSPLAQVVILSSAACRHK